jgi:hypothetical protein
MKGGINEATHVLMACVGKYDNGQIGEKRNWSRPVDQRNVSSILESVSLDEVE